MTCVEKTIRKRLVINDVISQKGKVQRNCLLYLLCITFAWALLMAIEMSGGKKSAEHGDDELRINGKTNHEW